MHVEKSKRSKIKSVFKGVFLANYKLDNCLCKKAANENNLKDFIRLLI